jgi:hypothetical protein
MREHEQRLTKGYKMPNWIDDSISKEISGTQLGERTWTVSGLKSKAALYAYFRSKHFLSRNGTFLQVQCHEGAVHQRQVVERGRDTAEVCVQDSSIRHFRRGSVTLTPLYG